MKTLIFLFLVSALFSAAGNATVQEITVWNRISDNPVAHQLLQLALEKTVNEYGPFTLKSSAPLEQERAKKELESNRQVNIANFAPSIEREKSLIPIRIPVTKGLLGYRVCLIAKGTQHRFDNINTLEALQNNISIGQGRDWPDTKILQSNGLRVETSVKYNALFDMLISGRFDCFSRSISEVHGELANYHQNGIELEKNLIIAYPLPSFFFVSKKSPELARRIEKGLITIIKEGSFDKIFDQFYKPLLKDLNFDHRTIIRLNNPLLSKKTQKIIGKPEFWLQSERR